MASLNDNGAIAGYPHNSMYPSVLLTFEILTRRKDFSEQKKNEQELTEETEKEVQIHFSVISVLQTFGFCALRANLRFNK